MRMVPGKTKLTPTGLNYQCNATSGVIRFRAHRSVFNLVLSQAWMGGPFDADAENRDLAWSNGRRLKPFTRPKSAHHPSNRPMPRSQFKTFTAAVQTSALLVSL